MAHKFYTKSVRDVKKSEGRVVAKVEKLEKQVLERIERSEKQVCQCKTVHQHVEEKESETHKSFVNSKL